MKVLTIKAEKRTELGKKATRELRKEDRVPAVVYGGEEMIHCHIFRNDLRHLFYTPEVHFVDLDVDGKVIRVIVKDTQWHPVTDMPLHIDFLQIFDEKPVVMGIPVRVEGQSVGVKRGGILKQEMRYLKLKALPAVLPENITLDITELDVLQSIRVRDLSQENVEFLDGGHMNVVTVATARGVSASSLTGGDDAEASEE